MASPDRKGIASVVENRYILPLAAVVEIMKQYPTSVVLRASLPSLPGRSKEACLAHIHLGEGKIFSCTITAKGAVLLQQQAACDALERCGDLEWEVESAPASQKEAQPISTFRRPVASPIPRLRVQSLTPSIRATLSHPYIQVLLLVDGQRSLEEIARLASKKAEEIRKMFATMKHLIDF